jgi:type IV secretory pathway ATPase VirB11/archaellum biosynthesis ATPase
MNDLELRLEGAMAVAADYGQLYYRFRNDYVEDIDLEILKRVERYVQHKKEKIAEAKRIQDLTEQNQRKAIKLLQEEFKCDEKKAAKVLVSLMGES